MLAQYMSTGEVTWGGMFKWFNNETVDIAAKVTASAALITYAKSQQAAEPVSEMVTSLLRKLGDTTYTLDSSPSPGVSWAEHLKTLPATTQLGGFTFRS